jgi:hypothetical protein
MIITLCTLVAKTLIYDVNNIVYTDNIETIINVHIWSYFLFLISI